MNEGRGFNILKEKIISLLNYFLGKLNSEENTTIENKFDTSQYEDLAPSDNVDNNVYHDTIEWAINNKNVKNIALTGSYGSGKSSIIETFIKKSSNKYKFLKVSLALFSQNVKKQSSYETETEEDVEQNDDESISVNEKTNRLLELSILQQIFYHVNPKSIPDSRFRRIKNLKKWNLCFRVVSVILLIVSLIIIFNPDFVKDLKFSGRIDSLIESEILQIILIVYILSVIGWVATKIFRIINNTKINKLNIQSGEIEISNKIDPSILNKHLDEILYFFEVKKYDIVIIEDLDRFENIEIFAKLREINLLINQSEQIKHRVVFIYAIKEDIFKNRDRVKFFDFIIPIVPIINSSNSEDILIEKIGNAGANVSEPFISDISLYIEDMRLLKNIFNEFILYNGSLKDSIPQIEIDDSCTNSEKLLSIIVYKNLYPDDFVDLHNNKGKLFSILDKKRDFIQDYIISIDSKIESLDIHIKNIQSEIVDNIKDLRKIYISTLAEVFPLISKIIINKDEFTLSELIDDNIFKLLSESNNKIKYKYYEEGSGGRIYSEEEASDKTFKDIELSVDKNNTYKERENIILSKSNDSLSKYREEVAKLKKERNEVQCMSLKKLLQQNKNKTIYDIINNDPLLIYLLESGYIDENYSSYISYFHEKALTKTDREFLINIRAYKAKPYNYKLDKIENLLNRIQDHYFGRKVILNIHLLSYLLSYENIYQNKLNKFLEQLKDNSPESKDFIDNYIDEGTSIKEFFNIFSKKWSELGDYIFINSNYTQEKKEKCLSYIISFVEVEDIVVLDKSNLSISSYISNKKDFLISIQDLELYDKVKDIIIELSIHFQALEYPKEWNDLYEFIYDCSLYIINISNIKFFLENKGVNEDDIINNFDTANYTTIMKSGCSHLIEYIEENIDIYLSEIFFNLSSINEEEEYYIKLLNNNNLDYDVLNKIVDKVDTKISDLSKVNGYYVTVMLLTSKKVIPNWRNILHYYDTVHELDPESNSKLKPIVGYLNDNEYCQALSLEKISLEGKNDEERKKIRKFSLDIIKCNEIINDNYKLILRSFPNNKWYNIDLAGLEESKVVILITEGFIPPSVGNFKMLKENFANQISLLEFYSGRLISITNDFKTRYEFDAKDLIGILKSTVFNKKQKVTIIERCKKEILIGDRQLSMLVNKLIILNKGLNLDFNTLLGLMKNEYTLMTKIEVFNLFIEKYNIEQIAALIATLGSPYMKIAKHSKQPRLPYNEHTYLFSEILLNKGLLYSNKSVIEKDGKKIIFHSSFPKK